MKYLKGRVLAAGLFGLVACAAILPVQSVAETPLYLDETKPIDVRVQDALSRMTTAEKVAILHAQSKFSSRGVAPLGIPDLWTSDGPHGVRPDVFWDEWDQAGCTNDSCIAFPALTALAATWNPEMARAYGKAIGEEALYRNKNVMLGPGVNIYRTPLNGRNFEYMGEDPYLSSCMVVPYVQGLQSNNVAACVKHFALNSNEINRHTSNAQVDDRTLYEIYLPAFKAAMIDGGAYSVMGAYNLYKNQHLCHNQYILNDILKGEWQYPGAVVSDWGGCHDTDQAITNGLDLEFGSWTNGLNEGKKNAYDSYFMADPYLERLADGRASKEGLDEKAARVLRLMMLTSMKSGKGHGEMNSPAHYALARKIGREGTVLLKNDRKVLPIPRNEGKKVLVVGENAIKMMTIGGGSSSLKVQHETLPLEGLRNVADKAGITVDYARGYVGDLGRVQDGMKAEQDLSDSRTPEQLIEEAVNKAKDADYVVFFGGLNKAPGQDCEDADREALELPYGQDKVIEALAKANPNLVVVNISGNAVAMPWVNEVPAIIQTWYLGSETGNSLADVLLGYTNPSGRLPFTFPRKLTDSPAHSPIVNPLAKSNPVKSYLGTKRADEDVWDVPYYEGLLVGYRWYDTKKIEPLFPFGYGLGYTTFAIGKPTLSASTLPAVMSAPGKESLRTTPRQAHEASVKAGRAVTLTVPVTNTGKRDGVQTVQVYITDVKAPVQRPAKELKAFGQVSLAPGETKELTFTITPDDMAYFDADAHEWTLHPGKYNIHVATSAADIASTLPLTLK